MEVAGQPSASGHFLAFVSTPMLKLLSASPASPHRRLPGRSNVAYIFCLYSTLNHPLESHMTRARDDGKCTVRSRCVLRCLGVTIHVGGPGTRSTCPVHFGYSIRMARSGEQWRMQAASSRHALLAADRRQSTQAASHSIGIAVARWRLDFYQMRWSCCSSVHHPAHTMPSTDRLDTPQYSPLRCSALCSASLSPGL